MGSKDQESWAEFLRSLPGMSEWVVSDRDGGIVEAVDKVWGGASIHYFIHYHLLKNAADAAVKDGFGKAVLDKLEDLLLDTAGTLPALHQAASRKPDGSFAAWLTDNEPALHEQIQKRQGRHPHPRSAGAAETYLRQTKASLLLRIVNFRNAQRLDRLLALMAHAARNLATERTYAGRLRAWFDANGGGRNAADWKAIRDPKGTSSIRVLIRDAEARGSQAKRRRASAKGVRNIRQRQAANAGLRAAQGLPPVPVRVTGPQVPPRSVVGMKVADFPELEAQWDWAANPGRTPAEVSAGSGEIINWRCPKGPDHEWPAQVRSRTINRSGCPFCAGRRVAVSNSLATTHPDIAAQWHARNGALKPTHVTYGTTREVWWQCSKYQSHVWLARVQSRTITLAGCPSCVATKGAGGRPKGGKAAKPAQVVRLPRTKRARARTTIKSRSQSGRRCRLGRRRVVRARPAAGGVQRLDAVVVRAHAEHMRDKSVPRAFYEADSLSTEIYDALAASIIPGSSVEGDIDFYRRLAAETGGPILDVGCGTGRVAAALAADGHEVVGIDLSAPMLRLAERRRAALEADVAARLSFSQADMTTIALGRDFALVVAPSRVFQFLLTTEAQRQALAALQSHLRPEGRLVLDLFDPLLDRVVPSTEVAARGGEVVHPTTGNRVTWEVTARNPDPARQLIVEEWTAQEIGPSGEVLRTNTERLTLRWSLRSEMRLLFERAGLEVVADYGDFGGGPPAYGREQVWVLRRVDG